MGYIDVKQILKLSNELFGNAHEKVLPKYVENLMLWDFNTNV